MKLGNFKLIKGLLVEILGWLLVVAGLAALVLPGPGLLALFAGMALLATRYSWAERRLEPIRKAALKAARDSVATWPRILMSASGVIILLTLGIVWSLQPAVPSWWPLANKWWLPGGRGLGISLIISAALAGAILLYSYVKFRETPPSD